MKRSDLIDPIENIMQLGQVDKRGKETGSLFVDLQLMMYADNACLRANALPKQESLL